MTHVELPADQVWALIAGALVPLITYLINKFAPWVDETIKATVLLIAAAVAGGVAQAITAGHVGFNDTTLQFVVTAVIAAFAAHGLGYKPAGVNQKLGGNVQDRDVVANKA